jgi:hypothetical protein
MVVYGANMCLYSEAILRKSEKELKNLHSHSRLNLTQFNMKKSSFFSHDGLID